MTFGRATIKGGVIAIIAFLLCVSVFKDNLYIYSNGVYLIRNGEFSFYQLGIDVLRCAIGFVASMCFLFFIPLHKYLNERSRNLICVLSRYSIGIYCLSMIILSIYYRMIGRLNINISYSIVYPLLLTGIIVIISYTTLNYCKKRKFLNKLFLGGR